MRSLEQLRAEARRLLGDVKQSQDATVKQTLAALALELAQEAEAITRLPNDVEGLRDTIVQIIRETSERDPRLLAQLLRDAEDKLEQISRQ